MSVNPDPAVITGVELATPSAPNATLLGLANAASAAVGVVTAVPLTDAVCTIAPDPFVPVMSTPLHCDAIHCVLDTVALVVMVRGPLPGAALMAPVVVAETVLASAPLELSVAVATPFTPVVPEAPVIALPLPVALTTTVAPDT